MNEIIIYADGTRTITGALAHELAFSLYWDQVAQQLIKGRFSVFEGPILKASQSTIKGAYSYMNPDRVLVYYNSPPESREESPLVENAVRINGPALCRKTIVEIRARVVEMCERFDSHAENAERVAGHEMAGNIREQAFGMRKVRMMLGRMLDEQAGHLQHSITTPPDESP